MPERDTGRSAALIADKQLSDKEADRYAEITAGLKAIQIIAILTPAPHSESEAAEREEFIANLLGGADAKERAKKLAALTSGLGDEEIVKLLAPGAQPVERAVADRDERARQEVDRLIASRKREIRERECFVFMGFV